MEVTVPDIGDFTDVPVIEILVAVGQEVAEEDPLVVLESDKATMEVPSPAAGKIGELLVSVGDKVSEGSPLVRLDGADGAKPAEAAAPEPAEQEPAAPEPAPTSDNHAQLLVLGSGVGGYTAAFRAADLGLDVVLVERHERLGGVCLNVGCIPSKALLHVAKVIAEAQLAVEHGVKFSDPEIDVDTLRGWKDDVVKKLTGGLAQMSKGRNVRVVQGEGRFTGPNAFAVNDETITFDSAIVAAGSTAAMLPGIPDDPRVVTSTGALELPEIPQRLLVIGGGIIGLEMAAVYDALGSKVTVVELLDQLLPGVDKDLVKPLQKRIEGRYEAIHVSTKVEKVEVADDGLRATLSNGETQTFDCVLVAVGRKPTAGDTFGLDTTGVTVDEQGFIGVDDQMRTSVAHIYAIGDIVGEPMLAHKASHQGKVAAEVIAGHNVVFEPRGIPNVAYTEPEVAWVGLTENDAKEQGIEVEKAVFPWSASGRALGVDGAYGMTKLLLDPDSRRLLGAGAVGPQAGDLIAEPTFALEMDAVAEDIGLTIHPHPTLSETIAFAAEAAEGTITDLPNKKLAKQKKAATRS
jgi:dihydrolipoamide dehydrogenase